MAEFLGFQLFHQPNERIEREECIWCCLPNKKNKAHIISRKLTNSSHEGMVLKNSVCETCNANIGKIENWILRNTLVTWLRLHYYLNSNKESDSSFVPSYYYDGVNGEWISYTLTGSNQRFSIDSQVIMGENGELRMFSPRTGDEDPGEVFKEFVLRYKATNGIPDIKENLPDDFNPRVIFLKEKIFLVGKTRADLDQLDELIRKGRLVEIQRHLVEISRPKQTRQHFRWSNENWGRLCAKICLELLSLYEGHSFVLNDNFSGVRKFVLSGVSKDDFEMVFDESGPMSDIPIPIPQVFDLTAGNNYPSDTEAFSVHLEPSMHGVAIYEVDSWIYATITISGLPHVFLALAGPGAHLNDFYIMTYNSKKDIFHHFGLACDPSQQALPFETTDAFIRKIARTYKTVN